MNERRLARLKRLATGAAIIGSSLGVAGDPKPGIEPIRVNSPPEQAPADAGVVVKKVEPVAEPEPRPEGPTVNSPPPKVKPKVNSPKPAPKK
jgi:hypothetical protein